MKCLMCSLLVVGVLAHRASAQPAPAPTSPSDDPSKATTDADAVSAEPLQASSDDIDLSSLGLDPGGSAFDDKLNVYGYADIAYRYGRALRHRDFIADAKGFSLGNANVYFAKNLTPEARSLLEVQFTFLPNGTRGASGYVNTTVLDPGNYNIPTKWGGIVIRRAYLEYDVTEYLTIRAGHWLTPYGIWNTDHGSPVIIAVTRPYIIDAGFFPEHQTGLDLFGSRHVGDFKLSYHATLTNGRSETEAQVDSDRKAAFGGRLEVDTPWGVRVGGSYYRGRYTGLPPATPGAVAPTYLEQSYGADAQFDFAGLHLQGEFASQNRHYATLAQAKAATGGAATTPDTNDLGFYVLGGYRFNYLWSVMPFSYFQYFKRADHTYLTSTTTAAVGLNFRPTANIVFKLQGQRAKFAEGDGLLQGTITYDLYAQAAWVF